MRFHVKFGIFFNNNEEREREESVGESNRGCGFRSGTFELSWQLIVISCFVLLCFFMEVFFFKR